MESTVKSVRMVRSHLNDIPEFALPAPFSLRWYKPGDEKAWFNLESRTEKLIPIGADLFRKEFGTDDPLIAQRMFFILDAEGREVGTTTAWFDPDFRGRDYGRIHWVAIAPEMQGKGLSKPLMSIACKRLKELGHERAYLVTDTARIAAIHLYLQFGFEPDISTEQDWKAWSEWGSTNVAGAAKTQTR